jgi:hypothetical protein
MADWASYRASMAGLRRLAERQQHLLIVPSHCPSALDAWRARYETDRRDAGG